MNSPTIFDEALHEDLREYRTPNPGITLFQYVDDFLVAAEDNESCLWGDETSLTDSAGNR